MEIFQHAVDLETRIIPELIVSNVNKPNFIADAIENTENDFMKIWLHYEGPLKILAWAAKKIPLSNGKTCTLTAAKPA